MPRNMAQNLPVSLKNCTIVVLSSVRQALLRQLLRSPVVGSYGISHVCGRFLLDP